MKEIDFLKKENGKIIILCFIELLIKVDKEKITTGN
jgi:hypothetical protein